jgi:hypothetical protein
MPKQFQVAIESSRAIANIMGAAPGAFHAYMGLQVVPRPPPGPPCYES